MATDTVTQLVIRLNEALNRGDVDTMMQLMTDDCIFENTDPAPDGTRYEGQLVVRAFWEDFFRNSFQPRIEIEEIFAQGERCIMRWRYHWGGETPNDFGHVRGVDVYRVREGRIAEKLSYVKG